MKYSEDKKIDIVAQKNVEENEEQNEFLNISFLDIYNVNTKDIHTKAKEFR